MASQGSFEDRIGKYKSADVLLQSYADYNPPGNLITKAGNTAFIAQVDAANLLVVAKKQIVDDKKSARAPLCFTIYDTNADVGITNPDCAQERLVRVHSYLGILLGAKSPTVGTVADMIKAIRPVSRGATSQKSFTIPAGQSIVVNNVVNNSLAFNTGNVNLDWNEVNGTNPPETVNPGEETTILAQSGTILIKNDSNLKAGKIKLFVKTGKAETNSASEKKFTVIDDFLSQVLQLIAGIGGGLVYSPPDPQLTVPELTSLRNQIRTATDQVSFAMDAYGKANRLRKDLYDAENGMTKRIAMIKRYLGSFPEGKKSNHYIEFSQAIKGT